MKILVIGCPNGQLEEVENLIKATECDAVYCLGDMCMCSDSTPLDKKMSSNFLSRFVDQSLQFMEFNNAGFAFSRPVFTLYGALDDPFLPNNELRVGNLYPKWNGIDMLNAGVDNKPINVGLLSGYHNIRNFDISNMRRRHKARERASLALCMEDFVVFRKIDNMEILLSYEAPLLPDTIGCQQISTVLNKCNVKINFSAHLRKHFIENYNNTTIIGLPSIKKNENIYAIIHTDDRTIDVEFDGAGRDIIWSARLES